MNKMMSPCIGFSIRRQRALPSLRASSQASQSSLVRLSEGAVACVGGSSSALAVLRGAQRGARRDSTLRQLAMYLSHVGLGVTLTATGLGLGRDRTTVRHGCRIVEDRRQDPALDQALIALEWGVRTMAVAVAQATCLAREDAHDSL